MAIAFVTPSYWRDFERCKLLCESTARFLPQGSEHILIVARRDLEMFRPLQTGTIRVVEAESLMPWWIFRLFGNEDWWASLRSRRISNWLHQQLLKISAVNATDAEIIHFLDSDVTLTRPVPVDYILRDGRVRLQRTQFHDPAHERWARVAAELLGVREALDMSHNYVGYFVTWTRPNVLGMIDRIRDITGSSPISAIARAIHFSEYMTYGIYVDYVVGLEDSGHFHDASTNLHLSWAYDLTTTHGLDQFFSALQSEHLGIMIHSKDEIPIENYRDRVRTVWDAAPSG